MGKFKNSKIYTAVGTLATAIMVAVGIITILYIFL